MALPRAERHPIDRLSFIQRSTVMDSIRTACATGDPQDIEKAKIFARRKGRVMGFVASAVLFNAERKP